MKDLMSKTEVIYCIPGLGLDHRIFDKLNIPSAQLKYIDFVEPEKQDTLASYAKRLAEFIQDKEFSIMGMSLGGILAIEIARFLTPKRLFLISTIKNKRERPSIMKWMDKVAISNDRATKLVVDASIAFKPYYDKSDQEGNQLFQEMLTKASPTFLNWGLKEISNWEYDEELNIPFYHIHGSSDIIFPLKNIDKAETLKGGTHYMLYNNAEEISKRIELYLQSVIP